MSLSPIVRAGGLLAGAGLMTCVVGCSTGSPGAVAASPSRVQSEVTRSAQEPSSVTTPTPEPSGSQDVYCAAMRQIADFEAALRAAGKDEAQVVAVYSGSNGDHEIEDAYARAGTAVPVVEPEVHVGLNYGELFTGRISADLAEGVPFDQANVPRTDPDWVRSQTAVDRYTKDECGFVVYKR